MNGTVTTPRGATGFMPPQSSNLVDGRPVLVAHAGLQNAQAELAKLLSELETRLECVLSPEPQSPEQPLKPVAPRGVSGLFLTAGEHAQFACYKVRSMLERLEV